MRIQFACLALSGLLAGPALAEPLPYADCMRGDQLRSFSYHDDVLLVDAGRRHYRITLTEACPELISAVGIGFRSSDPGRRICGFASEWIVAQGRRCRIGSIELVDEAEVDEAANGVHGSISLQRGTGNAAPAPIGDDENR
jgi:hypothetical protein